jgi:hypothetical protein
LDTQIDDGLDRNPRFRQIESCRIGAVIVCEQNGAAARADGEAVEVGASGRGQHDAGTVIAVKDQRPLDRPGAQYDLLCAHPPQPLARLVGRRQGQIVGNALEQNEIVVVEIAGGRSAAQDSHLGQDPEFGHNTLQPGGPCPSVEVGKRPALAQEGASELRLALGQDHPRPTPSGRQCRHQSGGAGPDHEHVAVSVAVQVAVGIGIGRRPTEAGGPPDEGLVDRLPP